MIVTDWLKKRIDANTEKKFYAPIQKIMQKYMTSRAAAKDFHADVEKHKTKKNSCRKGCSACCHLSVSVFESEAKVLALIIKLKANPGVVDMRQLEMHQFLSGNNEQWNIMPKSMRACPFLKDNECQVYDDRPYVCRTYDNTGDPKDCDDRNFDKIKKGPLNLKLEQSVSAMYSIERFGKMSNMIMEHLDGSTDSKSDSERVGAGEVTSEDTTREGISS